MDQPWIIIALLGAVIFLFAYIRSKGSKAEAMTSGALQDMEEAFEHIAHEMEEDNAKLMEHMAGLKASYEQQHQRMEKRLDSHTEQLSEQIAQLEHRQSQLEQRLEHMERQYEQQASAEDSNPRQNDVNESIRQRYHEIFDMYQQGKSVEYIAKQMGMNKGEVQLVLTLAQQEEAIRAER